MKRLNQILFVAFALTASTAFAAAPINTIDTSTAIQSSASSNNTTTSDSAADLTPHLNLAQRVTKLENQVSYFSSLSKKMDNVETQVATLKGQIDTANHQIGQYKKALSLVEQRLVQLEASNKLVASHDGLEKITSTHKTTSAGAAANYRNAFALVNKTEYKKAIDAFLTFTKKYPKDELTPDAYFWLGELYLVEGQPDLATQQFRKVIKISPTGDKTPTAMYKLGTIFLANGDSAHAKQMFSTIIKKFPHSGSSVLAKKELKTM